jgi:hypothetical protein
VGASPLRPDWALRLCGGLCSDNRIGLADLLCFVVNHFSLAEVLCFVVNHFFGRTAVADGCKAAQADGLDPAVIGIAMGKGFAMMRLHRLKLQNVPRGTF